MSRTPQYRRVLIIEDEPAVRNILYVLLAGLGCEGDAAPDGQQALAKIRREEFDAVLLDLRCSNVNAENVLPQIQEIRPNLVGRVLVITGEVADAATLDLIEHNCLQHVPRHRIQQDLLGQLRVLLRIPPSVKETP
ncbi:MAG: response regulator [Acidobacteriia bacterium]|nr:response regulator [Terriglobia bacterium]